MWRTLVTLPYTPQFVWDGQNTRALTVGNGTVTDTYVSTAFGDEKS